MKHIGSVVKKSKSFRVLFLRDDCKVVSFRLKPLWLKILGFVVVLFFAASGATGYSAHYYWKKYQTLQRELAELSQKLGENRRQLGRFAGLERLKEATLPRTAMAGVTSIVGTTGGANGKGNGQTQTGDQPAAQSGTPTQTAQGAQAVVVPQAAGSLPVVPEIADGTPPPDGTAHQAQGADFEEKEHPALVSEVQVRPAGNKTFKLAFDLSNRNQHLTLNGRVSLAVVIKTGEKHDITQIRHDNLRFIINRYKRVNADFVLPGDLQANDVTQIHLTVTAEELPLITYAFPVPTPS